MHWLQRRRWPAHMAMAAPLVGWPAVETGKASHNTHIRPMPRGSAKVTLWFGAAVSDQASSSQQAQDRRTWAGSMPAWRSRKRAGTKSCANAHRRAASRQQFDIPVEIVTPALVKV